MVSLPLLSVLVPELVSPPLLTVSLVAVLPFRQLVMFRPEPSLTTAHVAAPHDSRICHWKSLSQRARGWPDSSEQISSPTVLHACPSTDALTVGEQAARISRHIQAILPLMAHPTARHGLGGAVQPLPSPAYPATRRPLANP